MTKSRVARIAAAYRAELPAAVKAAIETAKWVTVVIVFMVAPYLWTGVQMVLVSKA